jgi:hypothetical protein
LSSLLRGDSRGSYSRLCRPALVGHEVPAAGSGLFPVAVGVLAGRGADPAPGSGRPVAGSVESPDLVSSLALHFPVLRYKAMPPELVHRVPAGIVVLFFPRRMEAIAFRKSTSFRWSMKISLEALAFDRLAGCLVCAIKSTHQGSARRSSNPRDCMSVLV